MTFNLLLLFTVLKIQPSCADEEGQNLNATNNTTPPTPEFSPIPSPSLSIAPSIGTVCTNTPYWVMYGVVVGNEFADLSFCDDIEVTCDDAGRTPASSWAPASDHCCKCKPECNGVCSTMEPKFSPTPSPSISIAPPIWCPVCYEIDDVTVCKDSLCGDENEFDNSGSVLFVVLATVVSLCTITCLKANQQSVQRQLALNTTRRTMSQRRVQRQSAGQTAASTPGPEDDNARHEQILTKFHFQTVLPDKSNTNLESIRSIGAAAQEDEEDGDIHPKDESGPSSTSPSRWLSSWRKPSAKDECCICLDGYHPGETICAAATPECNHVFHQECVVEWMKNHDECPLCRVNLMS
jgi:hypothetical protein